MKVIEVRIDELTYEKLLQVAKILNVKLEDLVQELVKLSTDLAYVGLMTELGETQVPHHPRPLN